MVIILSGAVYSLAAYLCLGHIVRKMDKLSDQNEKFTKTILPAEKVR